MDPSLIIFIALSAFIAYRLYSVLGARTGEERQRDVEGLQRARTRETREDAPPAAEPGTPKPLPPVSAAAEPLRTSDPSFDERAFIDGAKGAYEMIVEAFASGDLKSVRRYIAAPVFEAFKAAATARESDGRRTDLKFVGIEKARILEARIDGNDAVASVEFLSNQVRATYDKSGALVDGDPNRIDLVKDVWSFSRAVSSNDPNWTLVATGA
ncbi:MAG: Tim44/TimA family putative adaptor protein [Parvularculaceae bacterium]|nr:Tim44/TimA family putative adaptor protein [Parvularculaceae bacterium]